MNEGFILSSSFGFINAFGGEENEPSGFRTLFRTNHLGKSLRFFIPTKEWFEDPLNMGGGLNRVVNTSAIDALLVRLSEGDTSSLVELARSNPLFSPDIEMQFGSTSKSFFLDRMVEFAVNLYNMEVTGQGYDTALHRGYSLPVLMMDEDSTFRAAFVATPSFISFPELSLTDVTQPAIARFTVVTKGNVGELWGGYAESLSNYVTLVQGSNGAMQYADVVELTTTASIVGEVVTVAPPSDKDDTQPPSSSEKGSSNTLAVGVAGFVGGLLLGRNL